MSAIHDWALRHQIPPEAMQDFFRMFGQPITPPGNNSQGLAETDVSRRVRAEAATLGITLMRNNVGVAQDSRGVPVRFGLANDTPAMNKHLKSHDLVGWKPLMIEQRHVGLVIAQFITRETKRPGWQYTGTPREVAQLRFRDLVLSNGGDSAFVTGPGSFT